MRYSDAVLAFVVATAVAAVLTPLAGRLARRVGALAMPSERGLATRTTPLLGGLAILAGVLVAARDLDAGRHPARAHGRTRRPGSAGTVHTWAVLGGRVR